ncbi:uncharacterized protein LOC142597925 [Dermatophagoides farinae]|uniref:uncharacterized protein LOC142597925 n=1 Tax=Dermatophagoides farinae TaxID=6954 RepID=UPI003F647C90
MEALFHARYYNNSDVASILVKALQHESVLLKHEIAYVLGQMSVTDVKNTLIDLCNDKSQHEMVRHEAAEAIHALGFTDEETEACLRQHLNDDSIPFRQTVELALEGLLLKRKSNSEKKIKPHVPRFYLMTKKKKKQDLVIATYNTKDPVESDILIQTENELKKHFNILKDETQRLWDRYKALFALRNHDSKQAALYLASCLDEKSSALLRHEISFILGQMQIPETALKLIERLQDKNEFSMCRHEAAISLGSLGAIDYTEIGCYWQPKIIAELKNFLNDEDPIISESCQVALFNIQNECNLQLLPNLVLL